MKMFQRLDFGADEGDSMSRTEEGSIHLCERIFWSIVVAGEREPSNGPAVSGMPGDLPQRKRKFQNWSRVWHFVPP